VPKAVFVVQKQGRRHGHLLSRILAALNEDQPGRRLWAGMYHPQSFRFERECPQLSYQSCGKSGGVDKADTPPGTQHVPATAKDCGQVGEYFVPGCGLTDILAQSA